MRFGSIPDVKDGLDLYCVVTGFAEYKKWAFLEIVVSFFSRKRRGPLRFISLKG
jgi:hypothetical protein